MILIALGGNLPSRFGGPRETIEAAYREIERRGIRILKKSRFFRTAPVPISDQPWFVNTVIAVETALEPAELLAQLHAIEADFGRERRILNEARPIDLDLIAYHSIISTSDGQPTIPHPRMHQRAFVLLPLADIAAGWIHPVLNVPVQALIAALPADQTAEAFA